MPSQPAYWTNVRLPYAVEEYLSRNDAARANFSAFVRTQLEQFIAHCRVPEPTKLMCMRLDTKLSVSTKSVYLPKSEYRKFVSYARKASKGRPEARGADNFNALVVSALVQLLPSAVEAAA